MYAKVCKIADKLEQKYINFWADLCNIESPTDDKRGVDEAGALIIGAAKELDFDIVRGEEPISGDPFCIVMNGSADGTPIALSAHIDTVFPKGLFGSPAVKMDEDKIYGPGVMDCKGGVCAALYAMDALRRCGFDSRPIKLIVQTDEEVSSKYSEKRTVDFMYRHGVGSAAFLNLEGYSAGKCTVQRKGIVRYGVTVRGVAAHSSRCYEGVSAIKEAAHKIIELEKLTEGKEGITINCGLISGGTAENTVPEECTFAVDLRYPTECDLERASREISRIVSTDYTGGTESRLTVRSTRPAMELAQKNTALLEKLNSAFEKCGLPILAPTASTGGSDAADMTVRGLSTVDNLGTEGGYIHSTREYAYLRSLKESALRIVAAVLYVY